MTPSRPRNPRPGRPQSAARAAEVRRTRSRPVPSGAAERSPRFTGRAAILVVLLAVLTVSYASSMKAYLQQRSHIDTLRAQIAERSDSITALETEKQRWQDPAYVEQQARARFNFVYPGETTYRVIGADGQPLTGADTLEDPSTVGRPPVPTAWWANAWASIEGAGHPPKTTAPEPPATTITESDREKR